MLREHQRIQDYLDPKLYFALRDRYTSTGTRLRRTELFKRYTITLDLKSFALYLQIGFLQYRLFFSNFNFLFINDIKFDLLRFHVVETLYFI